ncbi:MAG: RNA polymerase sigma factor [Candidatus Cryptobacteroides sp.]
MTREQFIAEISTLQEPLRRFLLGMCRGNAFMADDIAQETLLKAYLHYDTFQGRSSFSTWLMRIGYNCFCNYLGNKFLDTGSITEREKQIPSEEEPEVDSSALYAAINGLSATEKAAVLLFYMEEYSTKEISDILGMPSVTVRSHLHRARRHLKKILEQNGE